MKMVKRSFALILALVTLCGVFVFPASAATVPFKTSSTSTIYYYVLKNVGTGKYLNISNNSSANNTNVNIWAKDNTSGENFSFFYDSKNSAYVIVPECASSRAINIYGSSAGAGKNVCTWTKTGDSTQAWVIEKVSNGYIIRSANNKNYVLTATGSSNGSNVNIQKYSASNKKQVWTLSLSKTVSTESASNSSVTAKMKSTYASALSKAGLSSFNGWCGKCVATQLQVLGITKSYSGFNGKDAYDSYKNTKTTTGGYKVTAYPSSSKTLKTLLNSLNNSVSCINNQYLMLGFEKGYGSEGATYGHVLLIFAVEGGKVFYTEAFVPSGCSNAYSCCKTIDAFCSAYSTYVYEGAILFSK